MIDQSSDICGWSIFRNANLFKYGSLKLSDRNPDKTPQAHAERRQYLAEQIQLLITKYNVNYVIYEDIYAANNVRTAILLAKIQGGIESICNINNIQFEEIKASEWRSYLPLKFETSRPKRKEIKKVVCNYIDSVYPKLINEIEDTKESIGMGLGWINKMEKIASS